MLLFGSPQTTSTDADVWTAGADLCADPDDVLHALTDPDMIAVWAPIAFEVEGMRGCRLEAGSHARVSGTMAGLRAAFDVEVTRADREMLELVAHGPVSFEVSYRFRRHSRGLLVDARVAMPRRRGLTAQLLRSAAAALLNAGALRTALRRLETSLPVATEPELLAA